MAAGCPACGAATTPELRFCLNCGTALAERCPSCSAPRVAGALFCGQCGTRFEAADAPRGRAAVGAAPASAPQTERRLVSVLFADLVGSTTRAEGQDPESVRDALNRYFETATQVITTYGGQVEKFIGDAVMAVWGTPQTFEDDAERAVRAALELVDAVAALGDPEARTGLAPLQIRAGVMTGEAAVTVGATGQGMVAGDLVNAASRLQAAAAPGTVLVDDATRRRSDLAIAFESSGEHTLRGKQEPIAAWRAIRVVAQRGGAGRTENLEPPFVGRQEELRLLKDQLHATGREGRARLVTILGSPGMGKSRLAWEFEKYVDGVLEPIYWHQGRSPSYGEGIGEWLDISLNQLRSALAWLRGDPVAGERGCREAIDRWRRLDVAFSLLTAELGLLALGGRALRGGDVLAQEARSIAERLGATTLADRLSKLTSGAGEPLRPATRDDVHQVVA